MAGCSRRRRSKVWRVRTRVSLGSSAWIVAERRCSRAHKPHLADRAAGADQGEGRHIAERGQHPNGQAAGLNEVEGVGGVVAMDDDLAAREPAPPGKGEQFVLLVV